jgi:O-antigen/teichoic acid export membrane protein
LLIASGLPLFGSMAIAFLMRTLDRIIVLKYLNTEALGHYSLAVMALGLLLYLPDSVAFVLYPRLLRRYRESGEDPAALRGPIERSTRALALTMPALCGVAYLAADDTVLWLLPRFRDGVPPLRILCFGAAALGLANVGAILLMTLRRQAVLVPVSLIVSGLGAACMVLVAQAGFGIRGVAWVSLATYALHSAILLSYAYATVTRSLARGLLMVTRELTPLAVAIPLAWVCNTLLPGGGATGIAPLVRLGAGLILFVTAYALLVLPLARGIGLREVARATPIPFLRGTAPRGADP